MIKQISITQKDYDIIPHLESQPNMSQYIIRLVRQDMRHSKPLTREEIIKLIGEYSGAIKNNPENASGVVDIVRNILDL